MPKPAAALPVDDIDGADETSPFYQALVKSYNHCAWEFGEASESEPTLVDLVGIDVGLFPGLDVIRNAPTKQAQAALAKDWVQDFYDFVDGLYPTLPTVTEDIESVLGVAMAYRKELADFEKHALQLQFNLRGILGQSPLARGNADHVRDMLKNFEDNQESVRREWIEPYLGRKLKRAEWLALKQFIRTLIAVHDLGKTFPHAVVVEIVDYLPFPETTKPGLKKFISLHMISDYTNIIEISVIKKLPSVIPRMLLKNTLGHNEGSGIPDVFWNAIAHPPNVTGPDRIPETFFGNLLAFLDRAGQSNLGAGGGVRKILGQELFNGKAWGKALVDQVLGQNAVNTLRQMAVIGGRVSAMNPSAAPVFQSTLYKNLVGMQRRSVYFYNGITWDSDTSGHGVINGRSYQFSNAQEFEDLLIEFEWIMVPSQNS